MRRSILLAPSVSRAKCSPAQDLENTTEPLDKRSTPQREMRYGAVEDGVKYLLTSPQLCMSIPATASILHSEELRILSLSLRIKRSSRISCGTGPRTSKLAIKWTIEKRTIEVRSSTRRVASSIPNFSGSSRALRRGIDRFAFFDGLEHF
jgi:hypothetical protein